MQKIFDPYFSTKQNGRGLGLAVVLSIFEKHGGQIHVESKVGIVTTFTTILPAVDRKNIVKPEIFRPSEKVSERSYGKTMRSPFSILPANSSQLSDTIAFWPRKGRR